MKVTYVAPVFDSSGYAEAARNDIYAMIQNEIEVEIKPISFEQENLGKGISKVLSDRINPKSDNQIRILHCTPENWKIHSVNNRHNIGIVAWETDKVPKQWLQFLPYVQEIWVPSVYNQ